MAGNTKEYRIYQRVKFAADLPLCPDCMEEVICPDCNIHFAECDCIGATEDDVDYREINGILYGFRL